ncbi:MAG: hypothetical protein ACFB0E_15185 [Leptolyngbyaceae cyanobacterium]
MMYEPQDIEQHFDTATIGYLQRKNTGGISGQKGTRYEDYFAIYKLATMAPGVLENGLPVHFLSQTLAFVDDLVIDIPSEPLQHYQLKNSSNVSWASGSHSIQDDFANQNYANQVILKRDSEICLVVSDQACSVRLTKRVPSYIQQFSQVIYFPHSTITGLLEQVSSFRVAVTYLSAFQEPAPDKLEYTAKALLGAWINASSNVSGQDLLTQAQKQTPQYIRSFKFSLALESEVENILSHIEDFKYNLAKGFLHWDYADGLQSGTQPYSIETEEFRRLQERIKDCHPTTFEELENLL